MQLAHNQFQFPTFRLNCILCKTSLDLIWLWLTVRFWPNRPLEAIYLVYKNHQAHFWPILLSWLDWMQNGSGMLARCVHVCVTTNKRVFDCVTLDWWVDWTPLLPFLTAVEKCLVQCMFDCSQTWADHQVWLLRNETGVQSCLPVATPLCGNQGRVLRNALPLSPF